MKRKCKWRILFFFVILTIIGCSRTDIKGIDFSELVRQILRCQFLEEREFLQEQGYSITEDSYIRRVDKEEENEYICIRIMVDYFELPENKKLQYLHKEDYFCFYDLETKELIQILYFNVEESSPITAYASDSFFYINFEDITFDKKEDLIISIYESDRDYYKCMAYYAYIWTEEGFQQEKSFEAMYYPMQIDSEAKTIIGIREIEKGYTETYYRYEQNKFEKYYLITYLTGTEKAEKELVFKETFDYSTKEYYSYPSPEKLLQDYGYFVSEDSYITDITKLESTKYDTIRISIDYIEQPENKYSHKEDYFYIYEKETEELFQILHYNVGDSWIGMGCGFEAHFDDVSFDGKEDLLINQGAGGASEYYRAYVWTEEGFQEKKSFNYIGSYELDSDTKSIIGFERIAGGYYNFYYRYEEDEFIEYRTEKNIFGSADTDEGIETIIDYKEIKDKDTKIDTYVFQIGKTTDCYQIEIQKTENKGIYDNWIGSIYEIRLYSSEKSEDIIETYSIIGEEEIEVYLEDLNFDGYKDFSVCWREEQDGTEKKHYHIFFWENNKFSAKSNIKDFVCDKKYQIFGDVKLLKRVLTIELNSSGEFKERTLFSFENGVYSPVRVFSSYQDYKSKTVHVIMTDYSEKEPSVIYDKILGEHQFTEQIGKLRELFEEIVWGKV